LDQVCTPENVFENNLIAYNSHFEGYNPGNEVLLKCWDASEEIEATVFTTQYFNPYGDAWDENVFPYGEGQYSILEVNFFTPPNFQQIEISEGYSFISTHIIPENPYMLVVLETILNDNLDFVRNSQGQTLQKIGPDWVNGIGNWIVDEAYLVKMFSGDSFIIGGNIVDPLTPISLEIGYQFVSYFPENMVNALIAFETILGDNLDFIRNSQGSVLRKIGQNWVNGICETMPGEGYLVKMNAEDVLIYPNPTKDRKTIRF